MFWTCQVDAWATCGHEALGPCSLCLGAEAPGTLPPASLVSGHDLRGTSPRTQNANRADGASLTESGENN